MWCCDGVIEILFEAENKMQKTLSMSYENENKKNNGRKRTTREKERTVPQQSEEDPKQNTFIYRLGRSNTGPLFF